MRQVEGEKPMI